LKAVNKFRRLLENDQLPLIVEEGSLVFRTTRASRQSRVFKVGPDVKTLVPYFAIPSDLSSLIETNIIATKLHLASAVIDYIVLTSAESGISMTDPDQFELTMQERVKNIYDNRQHYAFSMWALNGVATQATVDYFSNIGKEVEGESYEQRHERVNSAYSEALLAEESSYGEIFHMMAGIQGVDEQDFFLAEQCENHGYIPNQIPRKMFDKRNIKKDEFQNVSTTGATVEDLEKVLTTELTESEFAAYTTPLDESLYGIPFDAMGVPFFVNGKTLYFHVSEAGSRGKFYKKDISSAQGVFPHVVGGNAETSQRFKVSLRKINDTYGITQVVREQVLSKFKKDEIDQFFRVSKGSVSAKMVEIDESEYSSVARNSHSFDFDLWNSLN
jgi:hypothetical protein